MNSSKSPKGGRPSKGGGTNAIAVNLRIAREDHDALAEIASDIREPGRPMPTVQDVIRQLVRGARGEPETLRRLVNMGKI